MDATKVKIGDAKLPVLQPENFTEWKIKITSLLKAKGLYFLVEKTATDHEKQDKEYDKVNEEAKTIIYSSLDGRATQAAGVCSEAHELWLKVTGLYEGSKNDLTGIAMSRFMEISKQRQEKISDYLGRYEIALNNLKQTGQTVDMTLAVYVLTKTLPLNIKDGIRVWRTMNPKGTIDQLVSHIRANFREEDAVQDANNAAFLGVSKFESNWKNRNNPNSRYKRNTTGGNNNYKSANSGLSCSYCKKDGHNYTSCFKLKRENENRKNPHKHQAHMALQRSYHVYEQYLPIKERDRWIIDSGATSHMTHTKEILLNYSKFDKPEEILVGDGEHIEAEGKGWLFMCGEKGAKVLKNVLFVPSMTANLFSVKAALQDGYSINFSKNQVKVEHNGEQIPAYFDGCLFTIELTILNDCYAEKQLALTAYPLESWHKRFGHCGVNLIKRMKNNDMVLGLEIGQPPYQCEDCMLGKSCRKPHPSRTQLEATNKHAILHFDTVDTSVESITGARYFILGTEEYSGYKLIDFVSSKSDIKDCVKLMINSVVLNSGRPVVCIYSDNGTEFVNSDLQSWLKERGIIHELSSPYNAEQNGRAEASNKTVINGARTSLVSSGLPKKLWDEACRACVYVLNRLPSVNQPTITRYQLYTGRKPNVANLHEFGELAIRLTPKHLRTNKMSAVAKRYRFVGYTTRFNTYRLYDEEKDKIIIDCNVRFTYESRKFIPKKPTTEYTTIRWEIDSQQPAENRESTSDNNEQTTEESVMDISETTIDSAAAEAGSSTVESMDIQEQNQSTNQGELSSINDQIHAEISARSNSDTNRSSLIPQLDPPISRRITRQQTGSLKPIYDPKSLLPDFEPEESGRNVALYSINDEPETIKEAKESRDWQKWQEAMQEEIQALEENNTWIIVDKPPHIRPIKAKWIFKLKLKTDGSVERYKARLVAKGYSQIPDIDYKLTFAPVAAMTTVRLLLAAAVQYKMQIVQFDIKTAFLYGDLDEELYMECPAYYDAPEGKVCKLIKSLYGLKQAPRQWHKKFDSFLKKFKLIQSKYDRCLYYSEDRRVMLTIYVDDGLIIAQDSKLAIQLIDHLKEYLTVKTMDCKSFLGLEIIRRESSIFITQRQYIEKTLEKFGMTDCKPASTPEEMTLIDFTNSPKITDNFPFKELVGCLLYMVTCTRPDIAHAVSIASRTAEPTEAHWACLKRILRYLRGSTELGLEFKRENNPLLSGYSDADYANDKETRRSTSGFTIYWGDNLITWKCQRQTIVTLSTTEAEYIAGTELVKKLIPLKAMMAETKLIEDEPVQVYIDNKSTVNIVNNEQGQDRTKHIDVRHKWLNEHHDAGNIRISHISGENQRADILTKPLHKSKFAMNRNWLLSSMTMLALFVTLISICAAIRFKKTNPVYYRSSDVKYMNKLERYHFKVIIMNPCETYFTNITSKAEINKKLIDDCDIAYKRIARLDHCHNNTGIFRINRDVQSGPLDSVGDFFNTIGETFGLTSSETILQTNSTTQKQPIVYNSTIVKNREKRFLPVLGIGALVVVAGTQSYTNYKIDVNISNIKELASSINMDRRFMNEGFVVMREMRNTIEDINYKLSYLEHKLDKIDESLEQFPKIVALVNSYDNQFRDLSENLADIDNAALRNEASMSIFKIARNNSFADYGDIKLQLEYCAEDIKTPDKHMVFEYQFLMPRINPKIRIMKAESIRFWNRTEPNKYCWMKYAGPRYIMVNTSNSCQQDVQEYWITDKRIYSQPCRVDNHQLEPIPKVYHTDICRKEFWPRTRSV